MKIRWGKTIVGLFFFGMLATQVVLPTPTQAKGAGDFVPFNEASSQGPEYRDPPLGPREFDIRQASCDAKLQQQAEMTRNADQIEHVPAKDGIASHVVYWESERSARGAVVPASMQALPPDDILGITEDANGWPDTGGGHSYYMHVRYGVAAWHNGCNETPDDFAFRARTWCTVDGQSIMTPCARRLFVSSLFYKPCAPGSLCTVTEPWGDRDFLEAGTGGIVSQGIQHPIAFGSKSILSNTDFIEFEFTAPTPNHVTATYRFCSRWISVADPYPNGITSAHSSGCSGSLITN